MGRRWRYFGGCVGWCACFLALTGCVPTRHLPDDVSRQESAPHSKPEIKATKESTSSPTQGTATAKQSMPLGQPLPEPTVFRIASDDPLLLERIALYQQQKTEWEATGKQLVAQDSDNALPESWNECLQDIDLSLDGYQRLQRGDDDPKLWKFLGRDLHYFAKDCDQILASVQAKLSGAQEPAVSPIADSTLMQMQQYYAASQYEEVITAYEALPKSEDGSAAARELKMIYSRSLIKLGRLQEAADVLGKLMGEVSQPVDFTTLDSRILTGDVLLALGQLEAARQVYEGVAATLAPMVSQQEWVSTNIQTFSEQITPEDLATYREQLQAYLLFDGKQIPTALSDEAAQVPGQPKSSLIALRNILLARATDQSQTWARNQLTEIRAQLTVPNLKHARELLQELSATAPATMSSVINQLEVEITQAESMVAQETPPSMEEKPPISPWDEALRLFEQQKYDDSIAILQTLLDGEHGTDAQAKIAEASELAASALRRQAAALYAKAKKTFDPEAKRQSLLSSRTLLLELIEKYANSSVADKARQNLKVLELELGITAPPAP